MNATTQPQGVPGQTRSSRLGRLRIEDPQFRGCFPLENVASAGDFVCILDFTSPDYATLILACIHLGAVIVPLQTSAPARQHADIMAETAPRILAAGIDYLDAAVDAVLAGTVPQRLVVMSYDARRRASRQARSRTAQTGADPLSHGSRYARGRREQPKSVLPAGRFRAASTAAGFEMPALSAPMIHKYVADLKHLQLV